MAARTAVGDEILLYLGQIVVGEGSQLLRDQFTLDTGRCAVLVIAGEATLHDGFCHRLTAGTAHGLDYALDLECIATAGGYRLTAMETSVDGVLPREAR